jgi:tRNA-2-methylthio-N6-dimethylallyladenosine synthase
MERAQKAVSARETKKYILKTWGCQMNIYDSGRMADIVDALGYVPTENAEEADLVIFNTCHIREKASEKLFSELGRLKKKCDAAGKRVTIAVGGCVAQAEGAEIQRRMPYVDLVFGPQTYHLLPEMLARVAREEGHVLETAFPPDTKFDALPENGKQGGAAAFLAIQEGCDRFCSYCVVPYTRGAEYSRTPDALFAEASLLVKGGAREITLLGQNVNAYRMEGVNLAGLLRRLADIPDLLRLRYTTSHPSDMNEDSIKAHRDLPQLMPFLHLPVQSGSDSILEAMNRKHTADAYRRIVEKLRAARPDLALSSDFIVGFPGETDADFAATMKLVEDVDFAQAYSFKYSRRAGTPAAAMKKQIAEDVKEARLAALQDLLRAQQKRFNLSCVGKAMPVLVENGSRREGCVWGRSEYMQSVHVTGGAETVGRIVDVKVKSATLGGLQGGIANE